MLRMLQEHAKRMYNVTDRQTDRQTCDHTQCHRDSNMRRADRTIRRRNGNAADDANVYRARAPAQNSGPIEYTQYGC